MPRGVAAVHVDQRDVERERRRRDELLAVVVGRRHGADLGLAVDDVGAEPDARRHERHPPGRGLQARGGTCPRRARASRPRRSGGRRGSAARARSCRASRTGRRPGSPCPPRRAARCPDRRRRRSSGPSAPSAAIARTMLIGLRRDPQPPMPIVMPSRSSATTSSSVIRLSLTRWYPSPACATKASRCSSATPERLSSNVKPCSKR